ncbi:uncharacterized protein UBRO2_03538 [Ustilago bromivora]|uniref:Uncharacterized protein n=1 Tax=Ustilago bromivora TaxID=307758 RepID=A0A8H8TRG4_9BASI|nr:uncharacterized protein UBRO2_03538 [Ustilago bromivora]
MTLCFVAPLFTTIISIISKARHTNLDNTPTAAFPAPTPLALLAMSPIPDPTDPVPTPIVAQPPLILPATTPVLNPTIPAPPAPSVDTSHNFVTCSNFSASIVQHKPVLPTRIGEYQPSITYPWLPVDLIDKAHQDILSIYDLLKLANPSWPGSTALEEPALVLIKGFSIIKGPTTSTSNFLLHSSLELWLPDVAQRLLSAPASSSDLLSIPTGSSGPPYTPYPIPYLLAPVIIPASQPAPATLTFSNPLQVPLADLASPMLLSLQTLLPPARPNTTIAAPLHPSNGCPSRYGTMQAASGNWTKALLNYLDHPFVNQLLGAIDHGVHLGYSGPLYSGPSTIFLTPALPCPQQLLSVNDGVATHFTTIRYASLTAVLEFVQDNCQRSRT